MEHRFFLSVNWQDVVQKKVSALPPGPASAQAALLWRLPAFSPHSSYRPSSLRSPLRWTPGTLTMSSPPSPSQSPPQTTVSVRALLEESGWGVILTPALGCFLDVLVVA